MTDTRPELAATLDLAPHPEGGWFRETWRSAVEFTPEGYAGSRASATAIHFLLFPGEQSAPHTVRSDELWLWHRGGPLVLNIGGEEVILGPEVERGQVLQAVVPGGVIQAARPASDEYVLVSCIVSPGFDFADFHMD
ncbi:cupin domain-containing protein [Nocardia brasiliensis]|uniref:cupin domain-containing protein n=1 Tax=Nocardia brasiliensis TaxID=37326 RepID=UPI0004A6A9D5|nr:cupin domain-containing protein [Nocardia brasiliensis]MBF6124789.1 cupin domain-containing protein [Nocardia brasiliensis]MBF6548431.1 cupin domain-containing protein [Nocardia brasiliensis]